MPSSYNHHHQSRIYVFFLVDLSECTLVTSRQDKTTKPAAVEDKTNLMFNNAC